MTQVTLASKDSTPQVHGPFHIVLADLPATAAFAGAATLFTPNDGDFVSDAWCRVTVAAVTDGVDDSGLRIVVGDNTDIFPSVAAHGPTSTRVDRDNGGVSTGLPIKVVANNAAYTAGEVDLFVLVFPAS